MKKFTLILLLLLTFTAFAQQEETVDTKISETERIVDKYVDQASTAIAGLAEALQVPAEHVYSVLVKQAFVEGLAFLILFGIFILIGIILTYKTYTLFIKAKKEHNANKNNKDYYEITGQVEIFVWISSIYDFILLLIIGMSLPYCIMHAFNPEYYAIIEIMNFFK